MRLLCVAVQKPSNAYFCQVLPFCPTHHVGSAREKGTLLIHEIYELCLTAYLVKITPKSYNHSVKVPLYQSKVPFNVVNINLSKKPEWFLANTWGTVSVVRCRVDICRDRHDRRSCKICASCVNFLGNQRDVSQVLRKTTRFTHTKCDFALKLLTVYTLG